jgi:hypothetical protein
MKIRTENSVYYVNVRDQYVTGGVLGSRRLPYASFRNAVIGKRMEFFDQKGVLIMRTSPIKNVETTLPEYEKVAFGHYLFYESHS